MNAQNLQSNFTSPAQSTLPTTKQDPRICATDDESIAPRQPKKSKQSLDYMVRSALAGGAAGCAVSIDMDKPQFRDCIHYSGS